MSILAHIESAHKVETKTHDGQNLVFLSGYGVFDFKGTSSSWKIDELFIDLEGFTFQTLIQVAPVVSLASVEAKNPVNDAGWAVDNVKYEVSPTGQLRLISKIGVKGATAQLFRVTYQVTVLAN